MWPDLFGPGSESGPFVAAVIMVAIGAIMSFASSTPPSEPEPVVRVTRDGLSDGPRSESRGRPWSTWD